MDKSIRLKVKKELKSRDEKAVMQLKGSLIAKAYTDIIHISDEGNEFYINSFITLPEKNIEALNFIQDCINEKGLGDSVWII